MLEREDALNYRITVDVHTPLGMKSGSGVWEVRIRDAWLTSPDGQSRWTYQAQAIPVDLPGGPIFVMIGSETHPELPFDIIRNRMIALDPKSDWAESRKRLWPAWVNEKAAFSLPRSDFPTFVRFRDIQDPRTIEEIDPDNLAVLGPNIDLRGIHIQVTSDPVTEGIERRFPWWNAFKSRHFDGSQAILEGKGVKQYSSLSFATKGMP